jgi:hypothetical protein
MCLRRRPRWTLPTPLIVSRCAEPVRKLLALLIPLIVMVWLAPPQLRNETPDRSTSSPLTVSDWVAVGLPLTSLIVLVPI